MFICRNYSLTNISYIKRYIGTLKLEIKLKLLKIPLTSMCEHHLKPYLLNIIGAYYSGLRNSC
jgi:GTP cyclohydrolase I